MSKRIVIGPRARDGATGIFVSPPGVDADTAADSALRMNVTSKVSQLILIGHINSSGTVTLGLAQRPYVFITSTYDFSTVFGHTLGPGPMRPSPSFGGTVSTVTINSSGASMTISTTTPVTYFVYGAQF